MGAQGLANTSLCTIENGLVYSQAREQEERLVLAYV